MANASSLLPQTELKVVRQDVEEVRRMLQLSHQSRLRLIAKLQRTTAQLKVTSVQLEDSQLNFLMNSEEERERHNLEVAQYQDECRKLEARLRVVEASREEEMRKMQDAEDRYERLKHKHAKCRDLRRREQKVSIREEDVQREQAEVQSERTRLQTETEAIQEMKSKFKYYLGTMGLPQSQMDHMLSKIGQELSTFLREYVPGSSDSSSDQLDGVADESLEGSYERRELHLMLVEKNKFIAELKKENEDLKPTVDQLKAVLQELNHSTQRDLQATKAAREMLVREKRQLQGQLDLWRQNYFLVQRYPFFVHAFHLRGLHSLTSNGQQYVSSKVFCSDVEALTPDTVKEVLGTTRVVLSDLFGAVLEAVGRHLDLSLSATFHYCAKGKAKIYRFCIISASNVLVQDARIHPNPEEGGAISRALFAYSSVEVKEEVFKLFPFKPSIKGVYYLTDIEGRVKEFRHFFHPDMWTEEEPIKSITGHLDGALARHLDSLYSAFAKPKPIMSVPDTPANEPRSRPST
jgi:predicted  nucleic acid-binding Zn-ribbon protein